MHNWEIASDAEKNMKDIQLIAQDIGIQKDEIITMGNNVAKIVASKVLERCKNRPQGKLIVVTAITPTPLGEGKTTATIGLIQALGQLNKKVTGAIRQPSSGPTFNIKGSAAGGGKSQCIPLSPFSIRLTGDIDSVTNAHNLGMVALTARMQHEYNYNAERLKKIGMSRLNIDPKKVYWKWAMDFCAQALRNITIGRGGKMDGRAMRSGFQISVSSEIMAILSSSSIIV